MGVGVGLRAGERGGGEREQSEGRRGTCMRHVAPSQIYPSTKVASDVSMKLLCQLTWYDSIESC